VIYAPGTYEEAFFLTQRAFNMAAEYQVPVFVLTDQFLLDSLGTLPMLKLTDMKIEQHVIKTKSDYRRYLLTETGISPRGIPSYGEGLVVVDSDEHDESGHITEDLQLRTKMVDKRLRKKTVLLQENAIPPTLVGAKEPNLLVITWGSNYHVVKEAISEFDQNSIAMLHFCQVYPLHESSLEYLRSAERVTIVENNATAQFAGLIQRETGFVIDRNRMLLKYNGLPFAVEEVVDFLRHEAKQEMIMN
jgi:2-oxoglutarate ferredoxin oxidoreductase subunit alpha